MKSRLLKTLDFYWHWPPKWQFKKTNVGIGGKGVVIWWGVFLVLEVSYLLARGRAADIMERPLNFGRCFSHPLDVAVGRFLFFFSPVIGTLWATKKLIACTPIDCNCVVECFHEW